MVILPLLLEVLLTFYWSAAVAAAVAVSKAVLGFMVVAVVEAAEA